MRFNIVHNYIFIIIDDINNYIHKSKNYKSPIMPHVSVCDIHIRICNKRGRRPKNGNAVHTTDTTMLLFFVRDIYLFHLAIHFYPFRREHVFFNAKMVSITNKKRIFYNGREKIKQKQIGLIATLHLRFIRNICVNYNSSTIELINA